MTNKWNSICIPFPSYRLCNEIGIDSETTFILDLTDREKFYIANEYLKSEYAVSYEQIDESYIGKKVLLECISQDGWYTIHGTMDEYLEKVKRNIGYLFE